MFRYFTLKYRQKDFSSIKNSINIIYMSSWVGFVWICWSLSSIRFVKETRLKKKINKNDNIWQKRKLSGFSVYERNIIFFAYTYSVYNNHIDGKIRLPWETIIRGKDSPYLEKRYFLDRCLLLPSFSQCYFDFLIPYTEWNTFGEYSTIRSTPITYRRTT